ncbi:hypothetical protein RMATCC62417_17327 [Rhizopus microsporus]|nr:hypothetical protein RMATCC62417_17327 [Rhizopus microsporus]
MSMNSEPYWEDNFYDIGDWGSTSSCEISTEGPSKSTQVTQQLECTMPDKPEKSVGAGVVAKRGPIEKWSSNPMQTTSTMSNHLRRRFRLRLGSSSSTVQGLDPADILEQYDSIEVCEQGRGNIVRDSSRTSDSNTSSMQQLQREIDLPPHSWNSEYNSRSSQQKEDTSVRVSVTMEMVQLYKEAMEIQQVQCSSL